MAPPTGPRVCTPAPSTISAAPSPSTAATPRSSNDAATPYSTQGLYDRALADYGVALGLQPNDFEVYNSRGDIYRVRGLIERAIGDYDSALALNPSYFEAYINRGNAYRTRGIYEDAIADYEAAILLKPDHPVAYNARGIAYDGQGLYDRAIADYNTAIDLRPEYAPAYYNRGNAQFYLARFDLAARDYEALLRTNPSDIYRVIWLYLARERAGENGMVEMVGYAERIDVSRWPGPVIKLFLGQAGPREVMESLKGLSGDKRREQQCEALFYLGQYYMIEGNAEAAVSLFRRTLDTGVTKFNEYIGAKAELERLGLL